MTRKLCHLSQIYLIENPLKLKCEISLYAYETVKKLTSIYIYLT